MESDTTFSTQLYVSGPKQYNDEESVLITDFEGGFNPNLTFFNPPVQNQLKVIIQQKETGI